MIHDPDAALDDAHREISRLVVALEQAEAERDKALALLRSDPSGYPAALAKLEADLREETRNHLDDIRLLQKAEARLEEATGLIAELTIELKALARVRAWQDRWSVVHQVLPQWLQEHRAALEDN